jgi:hypothetical protein
MHAKILSYEGGVLVVESDKKKLKMSCLEKKLDKIDRRKYVLLYVHYPMDSLPEVIGIKNTNISAKNAAKLFVKLISLKGDM